MHGSSDHAAPGKPSSQAVFFADTRWDRLRHLSGVVLGPIAFAFVYLVGAAQLAPRGRALAAIMAAVAVFWITEAIPLPVTALLGAVLCILFGVANATTVLAHFADPIVFLFIGSFMLARAMTLHGLDRRIALALLSISWMSAHPARMLGGLGLVTALLSMWISNTATAAMMVPVALGLLGAIHNVRQKSALVPDGPLDARTWPLATGMMLMVGYAASIGGIATPVGSPPNLIGIGLIRSTLGVQISFFQWMTLAIPMFLVMGGALFVVLYALHPARPETIEAAFAKSGGQNATGPRLGSMFAYIAGERAALGGWTRGQINALIAFAVAVALWTIPGVLSLFLDKTDPYREFFEMRLPESVVAVLAAILLFVLPTNLQRSEFTLKWSDAVKIDWGTILLFGGGLSLGSLMFQTGVAQALADGITGLTGATSLWGLTAASIAMSLLITETTSNTAAANMVIPVVIALAQRAEISALPPALGACLAASYAFMLPVSTPPNAVVYGTGLVPITKMIRAGIIFELLGFVSILGGLRVLCPLLGLM